MGRLESQISPQPAGAGRWVDFFWPDPLICTGTAASNANGRCRLLNTQLAVATGGFGGGGATVNLANTAGFGRLTNTLVGGGADGVGQLIRSNPGTGPAVFQYQAKQGIPTQALNGDLAAARVYAVIAYSAFGGGSALADSGLECSYGGGLIQSQAAAGVGFCRSATGIVTARCQTVGGGASSQTTVTGPGTGFVGFNDALLHIYELQFVSATATTEATVAWLIDGVVVRQLSFGAGTVLPASGGTANAVWTVLVPNVAVGVTLNVAQIRIIQAPTIADCM